MVELVNLIGQAAQGLHSGETRHGYRRAHDYELPGASQCVVDEAHASVMSFQAESWMKTVPRRCSPHQAVTARVMTALALKKQLKDEMSVDLVNAQMAEAWQVQHKRWKPQLRQEETRDGQSSEVLKNQYMLHIMSENEKGRTYSLVVNQFTDLQRMSLRVRTLDTNSRTLASWSPQQDDSTTMVAFWIFQVIGIGRRAVSR